MSRKRSAYVGAFGFGLVWVFVVVYAVIDKDPGLITLATALTAIMPLPLGWLLGGEFIRKRLNGNGKGNDEAS